MTQEEKEVLLKDLCGRLPYGIKAWVVDDEPPISIVSYEAENTFVDKDGWSYGLDDIKPYLRSMSSITYDERKELYRLLLNVERLGLAYIMLGKYTFSPVYDWLNAHRFDYRGLIPMGLALEAREGMYGKEEEK